MKINPEFKYALLVSLFLGTFWAAVFVAAGTSPGWIAVAFLVGAMAGLFGCAMGRAAGSGRRDDE